MYRLRKNVFFLLLISLFPFLLSCSQEESVYLSFVNMFPYLIKGFEVKAIDFGIEDKSDEQHLSEGWDHSREDKTNKETFRWAIGRKSTIVVYCTEPTDKVVRMECEPFNPHDRPHQVAEVFINDIYLQKLSFTKRGEYSFRIPADMLNYGSNHVTFKWKYPRAPIDFGINEDVRKLTARFFYLRFMDGGQIAEVSNRDNKISVSNHNKVPKVIVPPGGIVEYHLDLPKKPILKFGLFTEAKLKKDSHVHIVFYNKKGGKIIHDLEIDHSNPQKEYKLEPRKFAEETVKFVFSNSIDNDPNCTVSWVNPVICSSAGKDLPSFWEVEKDEVIGKASKEGGKVSTKPHVFVYLIDTLRADHLSCYGYKKKTTPFIDEFSKDSVLFKNSFANASWTKPAVASILTGLSPQKHRAEDRKDKLPGDVMMIPEVLRSNGYYTVYITSNSNASKAFNFDQGNDFYKDDFHNFYKENYKEVRTDEEAGSALYHSSEFINSAFFKFTEDNPHVLKKPIFAYLHTVDPHDPYTPGKPFLKFKKMDKDREDLAFSKDIRFKKAHGGLSVEDIDFMVSLYDCEILHNDYCFGEFIDFLKKKELYENSIIVLIADHGEQFEEHGGLFHGYSIYNEEIHVPIIIKFPYAKFSGSRPEFFVSQVDIMPTILDYLGIEIPSEVDGASILYLLQNGDFKRTIFVKEYIDGFNFVGFIPNFNKMKHIIMYKDKYYTDIAYYKKYDLNQDLHELNNLFTSKNLFDIKSIKFKTDYLLEKMERSVSQKKEEVDYKKMDPEDLEALKALGYIR